MHILVPKFILNKFREKNQFGTLKAACLFVDLTGFSAMTSELMRIGQYGAEIMAEIMREIFSPMIESVYCHHGFVATFAGDAITALFPLETDEKQSLRHIIAAAIEIQNTIGTYQPPPTPVGNFSISVRIGVSCGDANWGIITSENQQRAAYYFRGTAIDACNDCQTLASTGQIVLDSAVVGPLATELDVTPVSDHFLLKGVKSTLPPIGALRESPFDLDIAKRFYPESILTQNLMGEFRHVVNMFISLPTVRTESQLEIFLKTLFAHQDRYGGLLNRIDFGDKGAHLLLFWGAPISYENDIVRALNFILSLQTETSIPINAGVTYQIAHAGYIGSKLREEYTCYGQGVNLAARFMTSAPRGEVWLDEPIASRSEEFYDIEPEGEFEFKGFEEKQKVYSLFERRQNVSPSVSGKFIGREKELAQLTDFAQPIAHHSPPKPVVVAGEPGIGKSRIVRELLESSTFPVEDFLTAHCQTDQMLRRSFNPFRYWLKNTFEILDSNADSRNKRNFNRRMDQLISQTEDPDLAAELDRTRSFLGSLVNLFWDDSLYEQLDPQGKYENTLIGLTSFLKAESLLHPVVLVIEDLQWIDSDSQVLLHHLYRSIRNEEDNQFPIFIIATTRELKEDILGKNVPFEILSLAPFSKNDIRQIAKSLLKGVAINTQFGEMLDRYSEGNPLYAEQIVQYLREEDQLVETETGLGILPNRTTVLPADTRALLVARLDQIQPQVKKVVLTAATLGREFHTLIIAHMQERDDHLSQAHQQAEQSGIWTSINETTFAFNSNLFRDTAYRMQTHAQRQQHHKNAVTAFEEIHQQDLAAYYPELAYHSENAKLSEKACQYYELAGKVTKREFQNQQTIYYFTKAISMAAELASADKLASLHLLREDVFHLIGDRTSQKQDLQKAKDLATQLNDPTLFAKVFFRQSRIHYLMSEYQESINHAQEAISLAQANQLPELEVEARVFWANSLLHLGEYESAIDQANQGLEIAQKNNNDTAIGICLNVLSLATIDLGNFPRAIELLEQSLATARSNQNYNLEAQTLNNLGMVYGEIGDFSSAYQVYTKAQEISQRIGARQGEGLTTSNLGWVAGQLGDFQAAKENLENSIRIAREMDDIYLQAFSLLNLSLFTTSEKSPEAAITYAQQGLDLLQKTGHKPGIAIALTYLGHALLEMGDHKEAQEKYQQALDIRTSLAQENFSMEPLAGLAEVQSSSQSADSAIPHITKILAFLDNGGSLDGIDQPFRIYTTVAKILLDQSDQRGETFTREAYALLQEKAGKIKDEHYKESFLSNIPCHLELTALYQRVTQAEKLPDSTSQSQR